MSSILSRKLSPVAVKPEWEQFVRDSLREATEARGPSPLPPRSDGRNVGLVLKEFTLGLLEELPARSTLPGYADMKGGADGRLWIQEYAPPRQDLAAWIGLGDFGERERLIEIPRGFNVLDISDRKVIVLAKGEFGEDLVEVYSINPSPTR